MDKQENDVYENYIGIEDAANYLNVKVCTIRGFIKNKNMPSHKVGKLWKFKVSELDEWIKSGKSAM